MLQVCKHDEQAIIEFDHDHVPRRVRGTVYGPDAYGILRVVSREHDTAVRWGHEQLPPTVHRLVALRFARGIENVAVFQSNEIDGEPLVICGEVVVLQRARPSLCHQPLTSKRWCDLHGG